MPARTAKRTRAFEKKAPSTAQSGLRLKRPCFSKSSKNVRANGHSHSIPVGGLIMLRWRGS